MVISYVFSRIVLECQELFLNVSFHIFLLNKNFKTTKYYIKHILHNCIYIVTIIITSIYIVGMKINLISNNEDFACNVSV